jgi:hypothetical protein
LQAPADPGDDEGAAVKRGKRSVKDASGRRWTSDPNTCAVAHRTELEALLTATQERVSAANKAGGGGGVGDGGALLRELGAKIKALCGLHDAAFFQHLPDGGTRVVIVQGQCPHYEHTLLDGQATPTGTVVRALVVALKAAATTLGVDVEAVYSNIAAECWRKSDAGGVNEPKDGQAGCMDTAGDTAEVLAIIKELFTVGLLSAGLCVAGIFAGSNASIASFGLPAETVEHFVLHELEGDTYAGIPVACGPHFKYGSPIPRFIAAVEGRIGGTAGDPLSTSSRVVEGYSKAGAALLGRAGDEAVIRDIYTSMQETVGVAAREWEYRHSTTTTPETAARIKAGRHASCSQGGEGCRAT